MNTFMGEISAGEEPGLTSKFIHLIDFVIYYVHVVNLSQNLSPQWDPSIKFPDLKPEILSHTLWGVIPMKLCKKTIYNLLIIFC